MTIRDAVLQDAPALYRLNCLSMGYDYPSLKLAKNGQDR